jgi:tight adherence protein C
MEYLSLIPFLALLLLYALLHARGKKTCAAYVEPLDKKEYSLRDFFYAGFALMNLTRYSYDRGVDRMLRRDLAELHPKEYVEFYLRVTWAQAASNLLLGLLLAAMLFGAGGGDVAYLTVGILLAGVLAWAAFHDVRRRVQSRHAQIAMDLPDLTNQILILSGAGLTLRAAILKIAQEMPPVTPLYQMLAQVAEKLDHGATDEEALDVLTTQCNMLEMRRFVSVILQNMHRGGTDVLTALREIGKELWNARRAAAQQIAEETSTKLLFPMMLMLLAVILLVAAPAVMGMGI